MKTPRRAIIFRIVLFYFLLSVLWITTSDALLFQLVEDRELAARISTYKGWGFVIITAGLLGLLLYRELKALEQAHARIEASEQRFRVLYQDAPIASQALDAAGRILIVNQAWLELFGCPADQAANRPFSDFLAPAARENFQAVFDEMVTSGNPVYAGELEIQPCDGAILLVSATARRIPLPPFDEAPESSRARPGRRQAIRANHGRLPAPAAAPVPRPAWYFTLQNVTEARRLEHETRLQQEEYRSILDTVPALVYYLDREQRIVRVNHAAALQQQASPGELVGRGMKEVFPASSAWIDDSFTEVLERGSPVLGKEYEVKTADGRSHWILVDRIPFLGGDGRPAGVVVFITNITDRVRRERDLEALVDAAAALRGLTSREDVYRTTLQIILNNLHVDGASLAVRSGGTADELVIRAAQGRWAALAGTQIRSGQGLSYRVVQSGQAELSQQVGAADSIDGQPYTGDLRAAGAVPLIAERQTLGAVWVGSSRAILQEDFRLLHAIAEVAAAALHRILLSDQTQLRLRRMSALHYIDMAISGSFDWRVTLNVLLSQTVSMLGVDAAAILSYDAELGTLEYAAGTGFMTGEITRVNLRLGESQAGVVALKREVRFISDLHEIQDPSISRFLREGEDFTTYCAAPLLAKGQVKGVLELFHRTRFNPDGEWMDFLEMLAAQAAIAIDNAGLFEDLQQSNSELRQAYDALILGWSRGLELRDAETQGHANRLVDLTLRLARRMHLPDSTLPHLRRGVLLHDIGKMGIPDSVLLKPGPLTPMEWQVMRQHPVFAYELLAPISYLRPAIDVPYAHHERWDGSGYPRGLKGEEIPITARLFAVVDVWDALTHDRPYRSAWTREQAVAYLREQAGVTLDPRAVEEFLALLQEES